MEVKEDADERLGCLSRHTLEGMDHISRAPVEDVDGRAEDGVELWIGQGLPGGGREGLGIRRRTQQDRLIAGQQADALGRLDHLLGQGLGVRDDPHPRAGGQRLPGGDLGDVDHRPATVHHHHAGLPEERVHRLTGGVGEASGAAVR
jgi:hypothetical protein